MSQAGERNQTLFSDLEHRETTRQDQAVQQREQIVFGHRNPLDESRLREIETELIALTGCAKKDRAVVSVCTHEQFQTRLRMNVPPRLQARGLHHTFHVIADKTNPRQIYIGPAALAGINEGHPNMLSQVAYALIRAYGNPSNLAFERGAADLLAKEIAQRVGVEMFTDQYPQEQEFTRAVIEAVKEWDEEVVDVVALLKRNPRQFYSKVRESKFYRWWVSYAKKTDGMSQYVNLIGSLASSTAQMEGNFMSWAKQVAEYYRDHRIQQRQNALAGAAKRADATESSD